MLELYIGTEEMWDEVNERFITAYDENKKIILEHSLLSLSKWESKWHKPFLDKKEKTKEETLDYIRCMALKPLSEEDLALIGPNELKKVNEYIEDKMTATWFRQTPGAGGGHTGEVTTSELIYYWMIEYGIPFDPCEKWHINRLMTLIRICSVKQSQGKKMGKRDILSSNASLNAARRKRLGTKG